MSRLDELTTTQIKELLAANGQPASEELILALKQFVQSVGSMENALAALDAIGELKKAA